MCKTCAKRVQTLSKNSGSEYILYAGDPAPLPGVVEKVRLSTNSTHVHTACFSTHKMVFLPQLYDMLSTVYTGPITNTTKYINK